MKRIIDHFLLLWKNSPTRKPLLLRGARQVGKTFAARTLGSNFSHCIEINFEKNNADFKKIFDKDLDPHRILLELTALTGQQITPGKTLLFFDEIQSIPRALTALRYFYEIIPELHIIAAGSLLDFTIEEIGIPVGRVESLYMYPVSFMEYVAATGNTPLIQYLLNHNPAEPISDALHAKALQLFGEYNAVGGMPFALTQWLTHKNVLEIAPCHSPLIDTYRQDFNKYSRTLQIKYISLIFDQIPYQLGRKFKYSLIEGEFRKRELSPALDTLITANVAHKVYYSAGSGLPLSAQYDPLDYKALFLDIGLAHTMLGMQNGGWFIDPTQEVINKGSLIEALVGQEILAYSTPHRRSSLYYWHKETRATTAEIDYLVQIDQNIIPIEVKSGKGSTLRSLHHFLETHPHSPYGIRFSMHNYSIQEKVHSYPLYALAPALLSSDSEVRAALRSL